MALPPLFSESDHILTIHIADNQNPRKNFGILSELDAGRAARERERTHEPDFNDAIRFCPFTTPGYTYVS